MIKSSFKSSILRMCTSISSGAPRWRGAGLSLKARGTASNDVVRTDYEHAERLPKWNQDPRHLYGISGTPELAAVYFNPNTSTTPARVKFPAVLVTPPLPSTVNKSRI